MSISLSMPINCSLEMPNSAAKSWIRVVATKPRSLLLAIGYRQARAPTPGLSLRRPAQAAYPIPLPTPSRSGRATPGPFLRPRAVPPSRSFAGWHRAPARRRPSLPAATPPERPPLQSRRCRLVRRGPAISSGDRSRRGLAPLFFFAAFFGHLIEEGHELVGQIGRHAGQLIDLFPFQVQDVLQRLLAGLFQDCHELGRQPLHLGQRDLGDRFFGGRQRREQRALAAALEPLAARIEVDLPTRQLRRQAHILSVTADRERQLVFVDDRLNRLGLRIGEYAGHPRGRERELREALRIGRPRHDVDALAVQLVHDGLHARALESHARAHGIDPVVPRPNGDLRATAGLTRGRANLDDLLLDLGDFEFEQSFHEQRIGARQDEPRPFGRLFDALQDRANRVALVEVLAVVLIAVGDDRFGFAELVQHDDDLAALDLLHLARQQLADFPGKLLANPAPLTLAHPLDDALLGRLHGGPAELLERDFFFQHVAGREFRILVARFLERDLRALVLDGLHHRLEHDDADRSLQLVDPDFGPHVGSVAFDEGGMQAVLEEVDQLAPFELLGVRQLFDCRNDIRCICHHNSSSLARRASFISESRYSCSAPPRGCSTTVPSVGTATILARTRPKPATFTFTSRPTKRTQWRCQRTGRSIPGLDTSRM